MIAYKQYAIVKRYSVVKIRSIQTNLKKKYKNFRLMFYNNYCLSTYYFVIETDFFNFFLASVILLGLVLNKYFCVPVRQVINVSSTLTSSNLKSKSSFSSSGMCVIRFKKFVFLNVHDCKVKDANAIVTKYIFRCNFTKPLKASIIFYN